LVLCVTKIEFRIKLLNRSLKTMS